MADGSIRSEQQFRRFYGWAELSPMDPIEAGCIGSWSVTYHLGRYGIDDSGMIRVARRFVSDWGNPQDDRPGELDFMSVSTSGQARVRARYDSQSHVRPWQKAAVSQTGIGSVPKGLKRQQLGIGIKEGGRWSELWKA